MRVEPTTHHRMCQVDRMVVSLAPAAPWKPVPIAWHGAPVASSGRSWATGELCQAIAPPQLELELGHD